VVAEITKARPQVDVNATVREFADRVEAASLPRAARTFTMTLQPPDAGSIEVAVKAAGSMLSIEVTASDTDVQTQLDRNRGEFVQAVEQKGMTVQTFNVNASQVNVNLGQSQQGTAQQQPNAQDFQQAVNLNGTGQRREETVPQSVPSRLTTTQIDLTA
jgi:flagellar hook-length control protein FliK